MLRLPQNLKACLLASSVAALVSACSLQDHVVPEPGIPVQNPDNPTLPAQYKLRTDGFKDNQDGKFLFGTVTDVGDVTKAGSVGILVSSQVLPDGPISNDPTIVKNPLIRNYRVRDFDAKDPLKAGEEIAAQEPFVYTNIYFRTYIAFEDGTIVYGNVFHREGLALPAKPANWIIETQSLGTGSLEMAFVKVGGIPAVELGFAMSYKQKQTDPIKALPNVLDKTVNSNGVDDAGSYIGKYSGYAIPIKFDFIEINYRAYLKLQDGSIVYGDVVNLKK